MKPIPKYVAFVLFIHKKNNINKMIALNPVFDN